MMNDLRLMPREEILRRLKRMHGEKYKRRPTEITRHDLAKWIGVEKRLITMHESGGFEISDNMQMLYSKFFELVDAGRLVIDPKSIERDGRKKELILLPESAVEKKTRKPARPYIDFRSASLKFDQ